MRATTANPFSILITDDDTGCRESLRDIVEAEGFRTRLASSGEEALDIVRGEPVHLALFDMHMPALTGSWAEATIGLEHPLTGERRAITFDHAAAAGRDDVVLVHLGHRLVQLALSLLRAEVWSDVLDLPSIDVQRTFFEQGGTSLQLVRVQQDLISTLTHGFRVRSCMIRPLNRSRSRIL